MATAPVSTRGRAFTLATAFRGLFAGQPLARRLLHLRLVKRSALLPTAALLAFAAGCGGPSWLGAPIRRAHWSAASTATASGGDARVQPLAPAPALYVLPARRDAGLAPGR